MCCSTEKHTDIRLIMYSVVSAVCLQSVCVCCEQILTLVANEACPSIGTVTSISPWATQPSVRTVFTGQTAVMAKRVVQTHCIQDKDVIDYHISEQNLFVVRDFPSSTAFFLAQQPQ
jgi:hypothetical protein